MRMRVLTRSAGTCSSRRGLSTEKRAIFVVLQDTHRNVSLWEGPWWVHSEPCPVSQPHSHTAQGQPQVTGDDEDVSVIQKRCPSSPRRFKEQLQTYFSIRLAGAPMCSSNGARHLEEGAGVGFGVSEACATLSVTWESCRTNYVPSSGGSRVRLRPPHLPAQRARSLEAGNIRQPRVRVKWGLHRFQSLCLLVFWVLHDEVNMWQFKNGNCCLRKGLITTWSNFDPQKRMPGLSTGVPSTKSESKFLGRLPWALPSGPPFPPCFTPPFFPFIYI